MLSNKRLVAVCAIVLCCNIALMTMFVKFNIGDKYYITISEEKRVLATLPDEFLSFGIDASQIELGAINFSDKRLRDLTTALAPARLRLGGTMSERLIFTVDDTPAPTCEECHHNRSRLVCSSVRKLCKHKFLPYFLMTGSNWRDINEFANATNSKLLFSFNVLLRNENGDWSDQNAKQLLDYTSLHNYKVDWQLGNEPNSFHHTFNISIPPEQLAHDFRKLKNVLKEYGMENSLLVGPDTTRPQDNRPECLQYMVEFLGNGSHHINSRSWHQYYLNSQTAKLSDFWNPNTFNLLKHQIHTMKNHTSVYNDIPMWLTETSSSYGGGAPGLSNSYAGTPLWIDKLGLAAKNNITVVIRQSLIGGNYSLLDKDLNPSPDWWVSVLFKRLVGNKVLSIKSKSSRHQRVYAHCANKHYTNDSSAITIYAINLEFNKVRFLLNGTALDSDFDIDEYIVSAPSNNRHTKVVLMNGWPLEYEGVQPTFKPHHIKHANQISMPPYSIGFWVLKNTSLKVCD